MLDFYYYNDVSLLTGLLCLEYKITLKSRKKLSNYINNALLFCTHHSTGRIGILYFYYCNDVSLLTGLLCLVLKITLKYRKIKYNQGCMRMHPNNTPVFRSE